MRHSASFGRLFLALYLVLSAFFFLQGSTEQLKSDKPYLFFQDPSINDRIHLSTTQDPDTNTVLLTRLFHNKVILSLNNIFVNISRSTDFVYFYSLSQTPFFSNENNTKSLFPLWEFPLFLIAALTLIQSWASMKHKYFFLIPSILVSLLCTAFILPYSYPLKLLPTVVTLKLITFIGIYELVSNYKPWLKKYFSL